MGAGDGPHGPHRGQGLVLQRGRGSSLSPAPPIHQASSLSHTRARCGGLRKERDPAPSCLGFTLWGEWDRIGVQRWRMEQHRKSYVEKVQGKH